MVEKSGGERIKIKIKRTIFEIQYMLAYFLNICIPLETTIIFVRWFSSLNMSFS